MDSLRQRRLAGAAGLPPDHQLGSALDPGAEAGASKPHGTRQAHAGTPGQVHRPDISCKSAGRRKAGKACLVCTANPGTTIPFQGLRAADHQRFGSAVHAIKTLARKKRMQVTDAVTEGHHNPYLRCNR